MQKTVICSAILASFTLSAVAQTPNPKLEFEVASVKVSGPLNLTSNNISALSATLGFHGGPGTDQPELLTIGRITLRNLLLRAFGVKILQISGPAWLTENPENFDISAKVPAGATKDDANVMLQNLLVERFGMVFHRESKDVAGYELVVGKSGSKLKESQVSATPPPPPAAQGPGVPFKIENDRNGIPQLPAGRTGVVMGSMAGGKQFFSGREMTMAQLQSNLESVLAKPVIDKTGLTGKYEVALAFDGTDLPGAFRPPAGLLPPGATAPTPAAAPEPTPSIFTAIQQDLGLRLDQKKVPVDLVVIDKLEKAPTEN